MKQPNPCQIHLSFFILKKIENYLKYLLIQKSVLFLQLSRLYLANVLKSIFTNQTSQIENHF